MKGYLVVSDFQWKPEDGSHQTIKKGTIYIPRYKMKFEKYMYLNNLYRKQIKIVTQSELEGVERNGSCTVPPSIREVAIRDSLVERVMRLEKAKQDIESELTGAVNDVGNAVNSPE